MELHNACGLMPFYECLLEESNQKVEPGTRGIFLFVTSVIIFHLNNLLDQIKPIEPIESINNEILYSDGNKMVSGYKKNKSKS
jgi:hypothetical protein